MSLLTAAAATAVALVLLASGLGHARDVRSTRAALAAHGVLPFALRRPVAVVLPAVEILLGAALLSGVLLSGVLSAGVSGTLAATLITLAAGAAAALLLGFTAYLLIVLRRTRGEQDVPCGCGLGATPVGPWAVLRAGLLGGLALLALLPTGPVLATDEAPLAAQVVVVLAAGLTLAITIAVLPAARAVPAALTTLRPAGGGR